MAEETLTSFAISLNYYNHLGSVAAICLERAAIINSRKSISVVVVDWLVLPV
jgi:hypothetical protein